MLKYIVILLSLSAPFLAYFLWLFWPRQSSDQPRPTHIPWSNLLLWSTIFIVLAFLGLGWVDESL